MVSEALAVYGTRIKESYKKKLHYKPPKTHKLLTKFIIHEFSQLKPGNSEERLR